MSLFAGEPALTGPDEPIVSQDDFTEWFGLTLAAGEENRVQTALEIASGIVRTGRRIFTKITDDVVTLDGTGGCDLLLPANRLPVVSVSSVTNLGTWDSSPVTVSATEYDWTPSGVLHLHRDATIGRYWTPRRGGVTVTYTHGYDPLPRAVAGVVLALAKRLYDQPGGQSVRTETLGDYAVTYDSASAGLLASEAEVLREYEVVQ